MEIILGTDYVMGDEYAMELRETNRIAPNPEGGTGWHRFQIIWLYRANQLYEYSRDMGKAEEFAVGQFRVLGGVVDGRRVYQEHTVNELREMADDMRWNKQAVDVKELFQIG